MCRIYGLPIGPKVVPYWGSNSIRGSQKGTTLGPMGRYYGSPENQTLAPKPLAACLRWRCHQADLVSPPLPDPNGKVLGPKIHACVEGMPPAMPGCIATLIDSEIHTLNGFGP